MVFRKMLQDGLNFLPCSDCIDKFQQCVGRHMRGQRQLLQEPLPPRRTVSPTGQSPCIEIRFRDRAIGGIPPFLRLPIQKGWLLYTSPIRSNT